MNRFFFTGCPPRRTDCTHLYCRYKAFLRAKIYHNRLINNPRSRSWHECCFQTPNQIGDESVPFTYQTHHDHIAPSTVEEKILVLYLNNTAFQVRIRFPTIKSTDHCPAKNYRVEVAKGCRGRHRVVLSLCGMFRKWLYHRS